MDLSGLIIPTGVARPGTLVKDVFAKCVDANVPGIPFCNEKGELVGKASIRHVLKITCIPDFMVKHARLLGNNIDKLAIKDDHIQHVMHLPIDDFVLKKMATANLTTPTTKALAIMEEFDTTYMFIINGSRYQGVVSIMGIAKVMLEGMQARA